MRNRGGGHDVDGNWNESPSDSLPAVSYTQYIYHLFCGKKKDNSTQFASKQIYKAVCEEPDRQSRKCFSWCRKTAKGINTQPSPKPVSPRHSFPTKNFRVLGIDISLWSASSQYIFITAGVMIFLLLYGYLQELVVMNKFKRNLGWFVTLLQLSGYAICAAFQHQIVHQGKSERRIPWKFYAVLSVLQVLMQGLTNVSMQYLNYPAKTLFKSSRVIMTMLFGIIFLGRKYHFHDYIVALCMVIGLTTFVGADANSSPSFDHRGVILVLFALAADAAILNLQEHCMHVFSAGHDELVYLSNVGAAVVAFCFSLFTGELSKGIAFLNVIGSLPVFLLFMAFSCAGFLGVSCLAALTKRFGALTSAITSVIRKGLTLILSYVVFPEGKVLTVWHIFGAMIFMGSLFLKSLHKMPSKDSKSEHLPHSATSDGITTLAKTTTVSKGPVSHFLDSYGQVVGGSIPHSWSSSSIVSSTSNPTLDLASAPDERFVNLNGISLEHNTNHIKIDADSRRSSWGTGNNNHSGVASLLGPSASEPRLWSPV